MSNKSGASDQVIPLPKGGGALKGIGEKFSPDLFTGTGNFTIPITLPPGRNGFEPELSLAYSTGNGNGVFGLGWTLSVPGISRRTSKGFPRYDDSDVFVLSGAEDLVPVESSGDITRYRPRTEGLFARIEHHRDTGNEHWKVASKDGLLSFYGTDPEDRPSEPGWEDPAVIAGPEVRDDPASSNRVFAWKLTKTQDPYGNRIVYAYDRDTYEEDSPQFDQLYLKKIRYVDYEDDSGTERFLVSVTFVYEDELEEAPKERPDPFLDSRAGFEMRTRRRCKRIETRTHAGEDAAVRDEGTLVRTYEFVYLDERVAAGEVDETALPSNAVSLLSQVRVVGHDETQGTEVDRTQELPPLEFGYTRFEPETKRYKPFSAVGGEVPDRSLGHPEYELVDLFGNSLPSVVQMNGRTRYWRNLGNGTFDLPREMKSAPAGTHLADPGVQMADMNGDGRADLLVTDGGRGGYYPLTFSGEWDERSYVRYRRTPATDLEDPDTKLMDLNGDGVIDALRTGTSFELYYNDGRDGGEGWDRIELHERKHDTDVFPDVIFSDPRVKLADMTGDGSQDMVLVCDGRVDYWPYLGYGRWGRRITMKDGPRFEDRSSYTGIGYDPRRVLLGDVDGDGCADLLHVGSGYITVWINRCGNGFSEPITIRATPPVTDEDAVRLADMHGIGTPGILWTYDYRSRRESTYKFLDLTGGTKPYLLNEIDNNMGALTRVGYAPSTKFHVEDQKNPATRWKTPLPFPVQVVVRVETIDQLSGGKLTMAYKYHHGYWDGHEREFRGFGMVERVDTESFEQYNGAGLHGPKVRFTRVEEPGRFSPPTLTRTWFHQGPVDEGFGRWSEPEDPEYEFWKDDLQMLTELRTGADPLESLQGRVRRDALRALRGCVLRTELYALDGTAREARPYAVSEYLHSVREEQAPAPDDTDRLRIFFPHTVAQRTTQWERGNDPMTRLDFTEDYDEYGQPLKQTQIACPRGWRRPEDTPEGSYLATRTMTVYARPIDPQRAYIMDRVARTTTYEINNDGTQRVLDLKRTPEGDTALEIIGQTLNFYDRDASRPDGGVFLGMPYRNLGGFGALARSETLILTERLLTKAYKGGEQGSDLPERPPYLVPGPRKSWTDEYPQEFRAKLPDLAGYSFRSGGEESGRGYFAATERRRYDFHENPDGKVYGLVTAFRDPLGNDTTITYDELFRLLPVAVVPPKESSEGVELRTTASYDYRVMQPRQVTDPNGNTTRYAFTPLGLLKEIWLWGNPENNEGDRGRPSTRMEYNLLAFDQSPPEARQPVFVRTVRHCHHDTENDVSLPQRDETIETVDYSDGFGRLLQTRTQAEDIVFGDTTLGGQVLPADQSDPAGDARDVLGQELPDKRRPRVVVSGWQTYDNKGRVVEKYEPFFSEKWEYMSPTDVQLGQKSTMYYDPRGQVIRMVNPDGSGRRVIYGTPADLGIPDDYAPTPWETYTYDANDNAGRTHAAKSQGYRHHQNTPTSTRVDALGRTLETIERNRKKPAEPTEPLSPVEEIRTSFAYDIRGNLTSVRDSLGRPAFEQLYDLANRVLRTRQLDAGLKRIVVDAAGNAVEQRDSKGALVLRALDALDRQVLQWARDGTDQRLTLRESLIYGDGSESGLTEAHAKAGNLLGRLYKSYDEAGLLTFDEHDFKGNVLEKARQVIDDEEILSVFNPPPPRWQVQAYRVNWQPPTGVSLAAHAGELLDGKVYRTSLTYDALNRNKTLHYPQSVAAIGGARKVLRPRYNRAGALERVEMDGTPYVERIAYDAKGQRTLIAYGNGVMTRYVYEAETFRLSRMRTERYTRPGPLTYRPTGAPLHLQDFAYKYDLVGNLLALSDRTPGGGLAAKPNSLERIFEYDPLYRLLSATGRECNDTPRPRLWTDDARCGFNSANHGTANQDNAPKLSIPYRESYTYDPAGNMISMRHSNGNDSWTRHFGMGRLTPQQWAQEWPKHSGAGEWKNPRGNRLTHVGDNNAAVPQTHFYDDNGNLVREGGVRNFEWDHSDRMRAYRTQKDGAAPSVHVHYLYDSSGQRVKKLVGKGLNLKDGRVLITTVEVTVYVDGFFEHHRIVKSGTARENYLLHVLDGQRRIAVVLIGEPFDDDKSPAVKYHLADHLGGSVLVVDDKGSWINREEYTPYGETSFGSFARKRYRFTGKERDEESRLYYHGARYYAPWLARWASPDPSGMVDGTNLYSYARDNPTRFVDSEGTQSGEGGDWAKEYNNLTPEQRARYNAEQRIRHQIGQDRSPEGIQKQLQLNAGARIVINSSAPPEYYSKQDKEIDKPIFGWLPGSRAGHYLAEAITGETMSGHKVNRTERLAHAGFSLAEDWVTLETAGAVAGLAGKGTGILQREGFDLVAQKLVSRFTGIPVTTPTGYELTRHAATETLAGRYALERGRRAGTMVEVDAIIETGTPTPQVRKQVTDLESGKQLVEESRSVKYQRTDLPGKPYVVTTRPTPHTPGRVVTIVIPKKTPPIKP